MIDSTTLNRFFGGLRSHLEVSEQHKKYISRFMGDGFNLFDIIGQYENSLSDVFANLLDPAYGHGQGTAFLSCLLDLAAEKIGRGSVGNAFAQIHQAVRQQEKVKVTREHVTSGRRFIDIVIEVGQFRVGIENKPRAGDLDMQVEDYITHLKQSSEHGWVFMYLSGDGTSPAVGSLSSDRRQELLQSGRYAELDYANDLTQWAQRCSAVCESDKIRWYIRDLRNYVLREFKSV